MTTVQALWPVADFDSSQHAESIARVVESSVLVRRRYQFFVWAQSKFGALVPHQIAVCGVYQRAARDLQFEIFNSILVPQPILNRLGDSRSPLMQMIVGNWIERQRRPLAIDLHTLGGVATGYDAARLIELGIDELLVHGVSRPERPAELESFFVFASVNRRSTESQQTYLDMLLPYLHTTWLRALTTERELVGVVSKSTQSRPASGNALITDRERQILSLVREGHSNQQIGEQLSISALTVKNHVQKILRKLSAVNRAQAVAKAMTLDLLDGAMRKDGVAPGQ
jgi:transcriptional regulator EpsA